MNAEAKKWIEDQYGSDGGHGMPQFLYDDLWAAMRWAYADAARIAGDWQETDDIAAKIEARAK